MSKSHSIKLPSVRKHAKGYFFIRIRGKDHYLGKDRSSANAQAKLLLSDYLQDQHVSQTVRPTSGEVSIEEIAVLFLLDEKEKFSKNEHDTGSFDRIRLSVKPLIEIYGRENPKNFGPLSLKYLRDQLIESGLARATINTRINIIRSCFRWAVENELCPAGVYHALQAVRGLQRGRSAAKGEKRVDPVPLEIVEKTLAELSSVVADLVRFQLHSGMRSSEMLVIRACDIDMSRPIWRYVPQKHKGTWRGKDRVVYFGPQCQKILKPYIERVGDNSTKYLFSPKDAVDEHKRKRQNHGETKPQPINQQSLRPHPKRAPGDKYRRDSYRNAILRACDRLGIERWFPHQLRHLAGTLAREVEGLDGSQHFLGHAHAKVTEIYSELRDSKAEAVAWKIG